MKNFNLKKIFAIFVFCSIFLYSTIMVSAITQSDKEIELNDYGNKDSITNDSTVNSLPPPYKDISYDENTINQLKVAYKDVMLKAKNKNIPLTMTFDGFVQGYQDYPDIKSYENAFDSVFGITPSTKSSPGKAWYYNIGDSLSSDFNPVYSKYKLLTTVKKGDVIFESKGGFGVTGHIAIVEGFYVSSKGQNYIRIIEAIDDGVVKSCLDDTRVDDRDVSILRVSRATTLNINESVNFCISQLGKPYSLDLAKNTSSAEKDWYCSELVWAGYFNQGINIEVAGNGEPGITPRDIRDSAETQDISFK